MHDRARPRAARRFRAVALLLAVLFALSSAPPADAQFIPYYGKNKVKYDDFNWRIYKSPHFEVYYYPEIEQHLARITSYLETAYEKLSSGLKHELSQPVPAIVYKTHTEFEQTNLNPGFLPEQVLAFAEPGRGRLLFPIDEPPDKLMGLIQHEMTHIFAFDIIPRSIVQRSIPLWIDEGLASYFEGVWNPLDLMMIRDAAVTEQVPKLTKSDFQPLSGRLVYNMGHAAFEFMEARFGKEGIRQFLYTLRKGILGGGQDEIFQQAFRMKPEEFDDAFDKWLKERFKPFRDKERPSDYGRNISPNPEKTPYTQVFAFAPSPSGELVAALTANRSEGEAEIVLLSTKDGSVISNLTKSLSGEFETLSINDNFVAGRSLSFDPKGDTVAFFGRTGKRRSLVVASVLNPHVLHKIPLELDQAQSPCLLPNGRQALFSALKDGVSDIWLADLESGQVKNLSNDPYYDLDPQVSPDGTLVTYTRRISGHDKVYIFPIADPARKTQLTFGPFDDATPAFSNDGKKVYYASTEDDDIYNLRGLDLTTGVVKQYTDVLGGNMAPAPISGRGQDRLAFISYFKGEYNLQTKDVVEPLKDVEQEVQASAEGFADFQPDVVHQVIPENKRRKKLFEGLLLEGRPPINVGVTSGGDFFGGSQVALTDVLGDQNFLFTVLSLREFRTYEGTYVNLGKRFQYGLSAFDRTLFFFPNYSFIPFTGDFREGLLATQRYTGATLNGVYPLDKFRRLEISGGVYKVKEQYEDPAVQAQVEEQARQLGVPLFLNNGWVTPVSVGLVSETTRFAEFGPLEGSTYALQFEVAPGIGSSLSRRTAVADLRKYLRLGSTSTLLAVRARGFYSAGDNPAIFYFGGNQELRGFDYYSLSGNKGFHANVELRLPVINLAATPIGILGPFRGTAYFGIGGAKYRGDTRYQFATSDAGISYLKDPVFGTPVSGFHLVNGLASYGLGLQVFFLGYPLHFDWSKRTDFKVTAPTRFDFWVGFDF
jgi:hypothetical protein